MNSLPKEITGPGPEAHQSRALNRFFEDIRLLPGPGYRIKKIPGGIVLQLQPIPGGAGASGLVGPFHIKSVQSDYLTCVSWDGTNEGTSNVYIAKDWKLRQSLTSELIYGITHAYTYQAGPDANNAQRTDTYSGTAETQLVTPPWVVSSMIAGHWVGDLVWAMPATTLVNDPTGAAIGLLLVGTRAWAGPSS